MRRLPLFPTLIGVAQDVTTAPPTPAKVDIDIDERSKQIAAGPRGVRRAHAKELQTALDRLAKARPCNGCTACCTTLGVHDLNKVPGQACKHEIKNGCGIYQRRPMECRQFFCMWRLGLMAEDERPDKNGIVLNPREMNGVSFLMVAEAFPGAVDAAAEKLEELAVAQGIAIVFGNVQEQMVTRVFGSAPAFFEMCMLNPDMIGLHVVQKNENGVTWFVAKEARPGSLKYFKERLSDAADELNSVVVTGEFYSTTPSDTFGPPDAIRMLASAITVRQGIGASLIGRA